MARTFTGTNKLATPAFTNPTTMTVVGWMDNHSGVNARVIFHGASGNIDLYVPSGTSDLVFSRQYATTDPTWTVPAAQLARAGASVDGGLFHFAFTHNGGTGAPICIINGIPVDVTVTIAPSGSLSTVSDALYIGNTNDGTRPLGGTVGRISLYEIELDENEIIAHMQGRIPQRGLLVDLPLEGGSPEPDRSSWRRDATLTGTPPIVRGAAPYTQAPSATLLQAFAAIVDAAANFTAEATLSAAGVVTPLLSAASFQASATMTVAAFSSGVDLGWSGSAWNGRLQIAVFQGIDGPLLADWSHIVERCTWSNSQHGYEALRAKIALPADQSLAWYQPQGLLHVEVNSDGRRIWEGRLEDPAIDSDGLTITALGYYSALADEPQSALWSETSLEDWKVLTSGEVAGYSPEQFEMDKENRLFAATRYGETFSTDKRAGWAYRGPSSGDRKITAISFDYQWSGFASYWRFYVAGYEDGGTPVELWALTGDATLQSATGVTVSTSGYSNIIFGLFLDTPSHVYNNTTGLRFFEVVNVRVTTASTPITSSTIIKGVVAEAATSTPQQLSATTSQIAETGVDLLQEAYFDEYPADIFERLALLGDNQSPPRQWAIGVWERRQVRFQPKGTNARTWYADIAELKTERTLENVTNVAYSVYSDVNGRELRSADTTDTISVIRYGVRRRQAVKTETSSATQAATTRDAVLSEGKDPIPRAGVVVDAIYDAAGCRWPLWEVRAGDVLTLRNLPPTAQAGINQIHSWRIGRAEYSADDDLLTLEPEESLPTLATLAARRGEGLDGEGPGRSKFTHKQAAKMKRKKKKKKR